MKNIISIAKSIGIPAKYLELYGNYKAKISLEILKHLKRRARAEYVVVTGITPTHLVEDVAIQPADETPPCGAGNKTSGSSRGRVEDDRLSAATISVTVAISVMTISVMGGT